MKLFELIQHLQRLRALVPPDTEVYVREDFGQKFTIKAAVIDELGVPHRVLLAAERKRDWE